MTVRERVRETILRNPYPAYSIFRRIRPALHIKSLKLWLLFDYSSVQRALTDHEAFSSQAAPPGGKPLKWMIFTDPPLHSKLRGLVMQAFTPRTVAALEPRVRALVSELLSPRLDSGEMDLVKDFAEPLPLAVITSILGVPLTDHRKLLRWSQAILGLGDAVAGDEAARRASVRYQSAYGEMRPYIAELLAERRAAPKDDLLSRLVTAELDGQRLSEDEIFDFFQLLLTAGTETTTNLISNAVLCLTAYPKQLAWVRDDLSRVPATLEEVLRYKTPIQLVFRTTTRDLKVHRQTIPKGSLVLPLVGSANRDERRFPHPSRFDLTRKPLPHVGFGHGIHFCLGAALARLEARVALEELLARCDDLKVPNRRWKPRNGVNVHGPQELVIRFKRRGAV